MNEIEKLKRIIVILKSQKSIMEEYEPLSSDAYDCAYEELQQSVEEDQNSYDKLEQELRQLECTHKWVANYGMALEDWRGEEKCLKCQKERKNKEKEKQCKQWWKEFKL